MGSPAGPSRKSAGAGVLALIESRIRSITDVTLWVVKALAETISLFRSPCARATSKTSLRRAWYHAGTLLASMDSKSLIAFTTLPDVSRTPSVTITAYL